MHEKDYTLFMLVGRLQGGRCIKDRRNPCSSDGPKAATALFVGEAQFLAGVVLVSTSSCNLDLRGLGGLDAAVASRSTWFLSVDGWRHHLRVETDSGE
jgi:hypothetical protein